MNRPIGAVLAGALLALAGCGSSDDGGGEPVVVDSLESNAPLTLTLSGDDAAGRCMAPSAEVLRGAAFAFAGEVRSVADGTATLTADRWYAGGPTDVVEVDAPSQSLQDLIGAASFEEGERFLVAADERGELLVCGYTAPYDDTLAALYAQAFGG